MKVKKLVAVILVVCIAALGLASCGNKEDTIKIGFIGPLTGSVAQYGIAVQKAVNMYIDELNANGGIDGKQVEIIEYDDTHNAVNAVNAYNRLVTADGAVAVLGAVTSAPTMAVAEASVADGTVVMTATATLPGITNYGDNIFRACFIDTLQGEAMVKFALNDLNAKTAAIIYNADDTYSTGLMQSFTQTAADMGLTIVATEGYNADDVDFSAQLTNIKAADPDVLFIPDYYETVYLIAQQAKAAALEATMLGVDGSDGVLELDGADPAAVEGLYFSNHYSTETDSALLKQFLSDYEAKYGSTPSAFDALGYDAAMILCAAIRAVADSGIEIAQSEEFNAALAAAIQATDMDCVTGHITYDELGDPIKQCVIIHISNGAYTFAGTVE